MGDPWRQAQQRASARMAVPGRMEADHQQEHQTTLRHLREPRAEALRAVGQQGACGGGLQRSWKALRPPPSPCSPCSLWFLDALAWCPFSSTPERLSGKGRAGCMMSVQKQLKKVTGQFFFTALPRQRCAEQRRRFRKGSSAHLVVNCLPSSAGRVGGVKIMPILLTEAPPT